MWQHGTNDTQRRCGRRAASAACPRPVCAVPCSPWLAAHCCAGAANWDGFWTDASTKFCAVLTPNMAVAGKRGQARVACMLGSCMWDGVWAATRRLQHACPSYTFAVCRQGCRRLRAFRLPLPLPPLHSTLHVTHSAQPSSAPLVQSAAASPQHSAPARTGAAVCQLYLRCPYLSSRLLPPPCGLNPPPPPPPPPPPHTHTPHPPTQARATPSASSTCAAAPTATAPCSPAAPRTLLGSPSTTRAPRRCPAGAPSPGWRPTEPMPSVLPLPPSPRPEPLQPCWLVGAGHPSCLPPPLAAMNVGCLLGQLVACGGGVPAGCTLHRSAPPAPAPPLASNAPRPSPAVARSHPQTPACAHFFSLFHAITARLCEGSLTLHPSPPHTAPFLLKPACTAEHAPTVLLSPLWRWCNGCVMQSCVCTSRQPARGSAACEVLRCCKASRTRPASRAPPPGYPAVLGRPLATPTRLQRSYFVCGSLSAQKQGFAASQLLDGGGHGRARHFQRCSARHLQRCSAQTCDEWQPWLPAAAVGAPLGAGSRAPAAAAAKGRRQGMTQRCRREHWREPSARVLMTPSGLNPVVFRLVPSLPFLVCVVAGRGNPAAARLYASRSIRHRGACSTGAHALPSTPAAGAII